MVPGERLQGRPGRRGPAAGERLRPLPEVLGEQHHVVTTVPQRRHLDAEDIQAVQEILAELAGPDVALQRPVRGRDHPHVDRP